MFKIRNFGIALLVSSFMACGNTDTGGNGSNGGQIQTTLTGWTRGAREVRAVRNLSSGTEIIARGEISGEGAFGLQLPESVTNLNVFSPPSGCTASPNDAKIAILATFDVYNPTTAKRTGQLVQTDNGNKFVFRFYADRDVTATGTCASGSSQQVLAMQLKRGWNSVTVESTGMNSFRLSTDPVTESLKWRFVVGSERTVNIIAPDSKFQIGNTMQLKAEVRDPDGELVLDDELTWTSSNSEIVSVNSKGVATAKSFGNAAVSVNIANAPATGSFVGLLVYGFDARAGTLNTNESILGTAVQLRYVDTMGKEPSQPFDFTITGPTGWNNDQPYLGTLQPRDPQAVMYKTYFVDIDTPPVVGEYTIWENSVALTSVNSQNQVTIFPTAAIQYPLGIVRNRMQPLAVSNGAKFSIRNTSEKIATVANAKLSAISKTATGVDLSATFESPANYDVIAQVYNISDRRFISKRLEFNSSYTSFSGIEIDPSKKYSINLYRTTYGVNDSNLMNLFSASRVSVPVDFQPKIYSLSAQGGSSIGEYYIDVVGVGFDGQTRVKFDSDYITDLYLVNPSIIRVKAPASAPKEVSVIVENSFGSSEPNGRIKFKYFDGKEFSANQPSQLLRALNGEMIFFDYEIHPEQSNKIKMHRISANGLTSNIEIKNVFSLPLDVKMDSHGSVFVLISGQVLKISSNNSIETLQVPSGIVFSSMAVDDTGAVWVSHYYDPKITKIKVDGTYMSYDIRPNGVGPEGGFSGLGDMEFDNNGQLWISHPYWGLGKLENDNQIKYLNGYSSSLFSKDLDGLVVTTPSFIQRFLNDGVETKINNVSCNNLPAIFMSGVFWCSIFNPTVSYGTEHMLRQIALDGMKIRDIVFPWDISYRTSEFSSSTTGAIWYIRGNKIGYIKP
jgi:hypothetical protein